MGLSPTFGARRFPKGERKELWCARRRKPFFRPGLTRRLRRGRWGCRLMGFHQLRCLKVSKGRAESPLVRPLAHTSCRRRGGLTRRLRRGRWGCRLMGFHQLRCLKVSKGRAESPLVRPLAHTSCRRGGIDAPTPARTVGLPPYGFSPASVPEGFQRASGKPFGAPAGANPFSGRV